MRGDYSSAVTDFEPSFRPGKRPRLDDTFRERTVYPPLQWMPLRVMSPGHKVGFIVGEWLAVYWLVVVLNLVLPATVVVGIEAVVDTVAIVTMARSFRGAGEPVAPPRPWWRLTARPRAGWWLAALYLLPGPARVEGTLSEMVVHGTADPARMVSALMSLALGAAFLNSSIRLTAERRRSRS